MAEKAFAIAPGGGEGVGGRHGKPMQPAYRDGHGQNVWKDLSPKGQKSPQW